MQKIKIVVIGRVKNKSILNEINDIRKRLSRVDVVELKEVKDKSIDVIKRDEFALFEKYIEKSNCNILLIENGIEFSTKEFYDKFKKENRDICFFITGAYGPNDELRDRIDICLSLSRMTFTHEMAQFLLVEQVYRMQCFEKNIPYTK